MGMSCGRAGVHILDEDGREAQPPPSVDVPKAVICDLFSGCGMLSLGLEESGVGEVRPGCTGPQAARTVSLPWL